MAQIIKFTRRSTAQTALPVPAPAAPHPAAQPVPGKSWASIANGNTSADVVVTEPKVDTKVSFSVLLFRVNCNLCQTGGWDDGWKDDVNVRLHASYLVAMAEKGLGSCDLLQDQGTCQYFDALMQMGRAQMDNTASQAIHVPVHGGSVAQYMLVCMCVNDCVHSSLLVAIKSC